MQTIGVVTQFFSGSYATLILSQLVAQAADRGLRLVVFRVGGGTAHLDPTLGSAVCDGWLLLSDCVDTAVISGWTARGLPVCTLAWSSPCPGVSSVRSDNGAGIRLAMESLFSAGHRRFVFLGNPFVDDLRERRDAFLTFLEEHDLPREPERLPVPRDLTSAEGWEEAARLEEAGLPFTALVAGNDQLALGALHYFRHRKFAIPHQRAVVGYDNSLSAQDPRYPLTSVDQNMAHIVRHSFEELLRRFESPLEPERHVRVRPWLAVRTSTHENALPLSSDEVTTLDLRIEALYSLDTNRFDVVGPAGAGGYLTSFCVFGRHALLSHLTGPTAECVFASDPRVGEAGQQSPTKDFGGSLVKLTRETGDLVVVVPFWIDGALGQALAVSFPVEQVCRVVPFGLAGQELDELVYALNRATEKARLEKLVNERTEELQAIQARLLQAARVGVMQPILTGIAHHLSTPLGTGLLAVTSLAEHLTLRGGDPELGPYAELIERSIRRTVALVTQFKSVAELLVHETSSLFDPLPEVKSVLALFEQRFPAIPLTVDFPTFGGTLEGEVAAFRAMLEAILENGAVHGQRSIPSPLRVLVQADPVCLDIRIEDDGPGLDPTLARQVFEPFFTTDLAQRNGLGLTLVENVVADLFHGTVQVETAPDAGFKVLCRFPWSAKPAPVVPRG